MGWRVAAALLRKNYTLQTRARRGLFGFGIDGFLGLLLQIALPALFFCLMCVPKYFIKPIPHRQQVTSKAVDLDSIWWSGPDPYSGPALQRNVSHPSAHLLLAPDTPAVQALAQVLARSLACPSSPLKRRCPAGLNPPNFHCLFLPAAAPPQCAEQGPCMADTACWGHLLRPGQGPGGLPAPISLARDEAGGLEEVLQRPPVWDALLVFERAGGGEGEGRGGGLGGQQGRERSGWGAGRKGVWEGEREGEGEEGGEGGGPISLSTQLGLMRVRMNHSDLPPTRLLLDVFDVQPSRLNGLSLWQSYWFFANLQSSVQRAVLGMRRAELGLQPSPPPAAAQAPPTSDFSPAQTLQPDPGGPLPPRLALPPGLYDTALPLEMSLAVKPFPWPAVTEDLGAASAAAFFNLLLVYAFLAPARAVVGGVVREKELRLREGMRIMGLSEGSYWSSWFLTHWSSLMASGLLCSLVSAYPFAHTSTAVMITFFALFTAALVCFSYFLSTLFTTSRVAGTAAQLMYAAAMLPGFIIPTAVPYGGLSWYLVCLLPPSAASLFASGLINWELVSAGINWTTLAMPIAQGSGFSVLSVLQLLALDCLIFAFLAWYCDKVLPTGHGQRLPPGFLFSRTYWQPPPAPAAPPHPHTAPLGGHSQRVQAPGALLAPPGGPDTRPGAPPPAIVVRDLVKAYTATQGGVTLAVNHLSCSLAAGRTTALLGHNGAGKTSLLHVLTGMVSPSSGSASINGLDVGTQMAQIRHSLGICPQFDILWPELTVMEHLVLYACIKGILGREQQQQQVAEAAAAEVGLSDKLHAAASELSGGQRRKLSVALAFLGDPAVVLIDEPTSGMDPYSRRFTWDLVRRRRGRACVLLTTHSMEEADALADDIIIMAAGRVAASGTPLELKAEYGEGYVLTAVLHPSPLLPPPLSSPAKLPQPPNHLPQGGGADQQLVQQQQGGQTPQELLPFLSPPTRSPDQSEVAAAPDPFGPRQLLGVGELEEAAGKLAGLVGQLVPQALALGRSGLEVAFRLPRASVPLFPPLLRALDACTPPPAPPTAPPPTATEPYGAADRSSRVPPLPPSPPTPPAGLQLTSYGLTASTLEEVFLAVTSKAAAAPPSPSPSPPPHLYPLPSPKADDEGDTLITLPLHPAPPHPPPPRLGGAALLWQQGRALLTKRALCARRDKLALLTQLLVPLALVTLSLWVSSLSIRSPSEPALQCDRGRVLSGAPSVMAAADSVRSAAAAAGGEEGSLWGGWLTAYGGEQQQVQDSLANATWQGGALGGSLEGYLLDAWFRGRPAYDALSLSVLPQALTWLTPGSPPLVATLLVNQTAVHGLPAALSSLNSAAWRFLEAGADAHPSAAGLPPAPGIGSGPQSPSVEPFQVVNHPLPTLPVEPVYRIRQDAGGLMLVVCLTLATSVLSASFAVFLVRERASNAKHVQLVSGTPVWLFWAATYGWDILQFAFSATGMVLLIVWFDLPQYQGQRLAAVASLLGMFGLAALPLTYLLQSPFTDEMLALQRLNTGFFLVGYLGFVTTWVVDLILIFTQPHSLRAINTWVKVVFRLVSPHFCFAKGVYDISQTFKSDIPLPIKRETNPWAWSVWGSPMAHMASQAVTYLLITALLDSSLLARLHLSVSRLANRVREKMQPRLKLSALGTPPRTHLNGHTHSGVEEGEGEGLLTPLLVPAPPSGPAAVELGRGDREGGRVTTATEAEGVGWRQGWGGDSAGGTGREGEDEDVRRERESVQAIGGKTLAVTAAVVLDGLAKTYPQGSLLLRLARWLAPRRTPPPLPTPARPALTWPAAERGARGAGGRQGAGAEQAGAGPVAAVKGLWLSSPPGECFGLLGVNGAGKTTTFRMLTGEVLPDDGDAWVAGCSTSSSMEAARHHMGYCPQFEALLGAMTAEEVLSLYARLRGVQESHIPPMVSHLIARVGLSPHARNACGTYSGGNKRKLALAVALVADPPVALLDEPSTGMDPGAKREMWSLLQTEVMAAGRCVLLTSHSMEECEALCQRVGIMVAGRFACLGSCQHLRSRFGGGYVVDVRCDSTGEELHAVAAALHAKLQGICPAATLMLVDEAGRMSWSLPGPSLDLASVFELLTTESTPASEPDTAITFSVTQTSLEHVFVRLATEAAASGGVQTPNA